MAKQKTVESQNDRLRAHLESVKDQIDLKTASGRRKSQELYLADNPDASPSALPAAHHAVLMKKAKEWGHRATDYKAGTRGQKKLVDPKIRATIRPTPSGAGAGDARQGQQQQQQQQQPGPDGVHRGTIPNQTAPPPGTTYTVKGAGAVLNCAYNVLRIPRPYADKLSADDREALGEMWAPIFNRHLQGHAHAEIGIAVLATLGLFSEKIIDSDGENRAKWEAAQALKKQKIMEQQGGFRKEPEPEQQTHEQGQTDQVAAAARKEFGDKAIQGGSDY